MINYIRRVSVDPIRNVEEAQETIRLVGYGFYSLGVIWLILWVVDLALAGLYHVDLSEGRIVNMVVGFLIIAGAGFLLHQVKSTGIAVVCVMMWIAVNYFNAPSLFRHGFIQSLGFDVAWRTVELVFEVSGILVSLGGLRATFQLHHIKGIENVK